MTTIEVSRLGLAAFVKMHDGKLVKYEAGKFYFESDRSVSDWEVDYTNSCCSRHDAELMNLRKLMK